jgi:hypothetical protein
MWDSIGTNKNIELNYDNCHDANKYELNKRTIIDLDKQLND